MKRARRALSSAAVVSMLLVVSLAVVAEAYVTTTQSNSDQLSSQGSSITGLQSEIQQLSSQVQGGHLGSNVTLPVMDQQPTFRTIRETWYLSPAAHQDRFEPSFIVVNQGDTVRLILIDNDTVAHDFVIGPPYNIIVNATVPGLVNDLTHQNFTTDATHNSPGVEVEGTPGNVSATYTFVASYTGIYEFVCTYHAQVGMIGYLVVLPNAAFSQSTSTEVSSTATAASPVQVSIVQGALNPPNKGYSPDNITLVLGVNNTVTWTNNDSSIHTVTANDGSFDSGYLNTGQSYSYTFPKAGVYEYHCTLHPWMVGYVTVLAA